MFGSMHGILIFITKPKLMRTEREEPINRHILLPDYEN